MIAHVNGIVSRLDANSVVIDVNGVGYRVFVPLGVLSSLPAPGGKAFLHTILSVAANTFDFTLYGFSSTEEQQVFQILTSVSGVGAKVALSMLSVLDVAELSRAISGSDTRTLTKVPGVGPKLAQRICLELGERMAEFTFAQRVETMTSRNTSEENEAFEDIVEALVNLGYSRPDSKKAAERAVSNATDKANTPALIRDALNLLSSGGKR
jgi:holliday junction DNA helicase RuvA